MPKVPNLRKSDDTDDKPVNDSNRESASAGLQPSNTETTIETKTEQIDTQLPKNDEYEHRLSSSNVVVTSNEPAEVPVEEQLKQVAKDAEANFKAQVAETQSDNEQGEANQADRDAVDDAERAKRDQKTGAKGNDLPFIADSNDKKEDTNGK